MKSQYILIRRLLCYCLVFLIGACAVFKEERNYSKNGLTIMFRSINHLDDIGSLKFQYPIILSEKNIRHHLLSLFHTNIVSPKSPKAVFTRATAAKMAPLLKNVMKKVRPGQYLHFEYQGSRGITEGQVFVASNKIHWRLLRINGIAYSNDPLRIKKPTWKLVRMPGLGYQTFKSGGFKKAAKNRVIANINLPFPKYRNKLRLINNLLRKK